MIPGICVGYRCLESAAGCCRIGQALFKCGVCCPVVSGGFLLFDAKLGLTMLRSDVLVILLFARSGLMWHRLVFVALLGSVAANSGCSMAVKQAYYGVRGSSGKFYEIKVVDADVLGQYETVRFDPFTNELGDHVPQKIIDRVNESVPEALQDSELFSDSGKELVVQGRIVHYTGKSGLFGAVGSVLSAGEQCVCRVQLVDSASQSVIGEAVCWGEVKSAVRRGSNELAQGLGKGIVKWLAERMNSDIEDEEVVKD